MLGNDFVFEAGLSSFALELNEQTFAQISRAHAGRIKALDEREHVLEVLLRDAGVERHFLRCSLKKSVVVDVADDELGRLAIAGIEHVLVELPHEMLLERLLRGDGIEKELPFIFRFLRTAAVAARLRHVIAPLLIELGQFIEFLFKFFVRGGVGLAALICIGLIGQLFQHRVCFHLLLHEIAQLEKRCLEDEEALLELGREDLVQRKILRLVHAWAGHMRSLPSSTGRGKQFARPAHRSAPFCMAKIPLRNTTCS